jgi:hypothetical protein
MPQYWEWIVERNTNIPNDNATGDDVDIVMVIVDQMKELMLRHQLWWVKAHQDDKRPYEDLDLQGN